MSKLRYNFQPAGDGFSTLYPSIDWETYSEAGYIWRQGAWRGIEDRKSGISAVGAAKYAENPSTEPLSLAYDLGNAPQLWTPEKTPAAVIPMDLGLYVRQGGILSAWNAAFEFYIWNLCMVPKYGWPPLPLRQLRCAMAKARAFGLPGPLKEAAAATDAPEQKDKAGDNLIRALCIPRKPSPKNLICRRTPQTDPDKFAALYEYNIQDIKAEAAVSALVPDLSDFEQEMWFIDREINGRGVYIDPDGMEAAADIINQAHARYTVELSEITGGAVNSAGEVAKLTGWLAGAGCRIPDLREETVSSVLKYDKIPDPCRRALEIRQSLSTSSVKKVFSIRSRLCADGRVRDLFEYYGADRTGRWAGRGPQPQNLPSGGPAVIRCNRCGVHFWTALAECPRCGSRDGESADWNAAAAEFALAAIKTRDLETVETLWGDATAAVSGCLRGLFCAAPGCDLICSDFSAIEAVVLAALAGETWRLEVFRTHGKIYEQSAAAITGTPFQEFLDYKKETGDHHPKRKLGKVAELASGYAGWIGAWLNFGADEFLTESEIKDAILKWRKASPSIVEFWGGQWRKDPDRWAFRYELHGLEGAAVAAVKNPGQCYEFRGIGYGVKDGILYCRLPSGRTLKYHDPRLIPDESPAGNKIDRLMYYGWNTNPEKGRMGWSPLDTYGGKLTENVVQAVARDILANSIQNLTRAGFPVVLHVHDEIVAEVPEGTRSVAEFEDIMGQMPAWAAGWPVRAAGGWRGKRYRKD